MNKTFNNALKLHIFSNLYLILIIYKVTKKTPLRVTLTLNFCILAKVYSFLQIECDPERF